MDLTWDEFYFDLVYIYFIDQAGQEQRLSEAIPYIVALNDLISLRKSFPLMKFQLIPASKDQTT